jgi:hypothetical protein
MHKIFAAAILGAILAVAQTQTPAPPTAAELLQKGIYAQETAGDLEAAAKIYRQIVDSHPIQREIAAQAQYRLGITLLQKGDAALASQEIQRLGWDFPDYKELISSAKGASTTIPKGAIVFRQGVYRPGPGQATRALTFDSVAEAVGTPEQQRRMFEDVIADSKEPTVQGVNHDAEFDFTKSVTVIGTVTQVQFMNPIVWLTVNPVSISGPLSGATATIRISLASPKALVDDGWDTGTNAILSGGKGQFTIIGAPALDGTSTLQATSVSANGLNGLVLFTRSATPK